MLYRLADKEIELFMEEDVPYMDLTTHLLGIGGLPGRIVFTSRNDAVLCCSEEAARVLEKSGCRVTRCLDSGTRVTGGELLLEAKGPAAALHAGWKVAVNLLEYASGIASRTARIVDVARHANEGIAVVSTRKSFPGTRKVALKAACAGGALPHRLGLSDSILVFRQHTLFCSGADDLAGRLRQMKAQAPEMKVMVEAESASEALSIAGYGVDVLQLDKIAPSELAGLVPEIRRRDPAVKVSAAGGITEENAGSYAATGVDILVLSSVYFGKPADVGVAINPLS